MIISTGAEKHLAKFNSTPFHDKNATNWYGSNLPQYNKDHI